VSRTRSKNLDSAGLPPGTLFCAKDKCQVDARKFKILYDLLHFQQTELTKIDENVLLDGKQDNNFLWLDVLGAEDFQAIKALGDIFQLHSVVLEDIVNTEHRPKMELYANYLFIVVNNLYFQGKNHELKTEQIDIILGKDYVISFQETEDDTFKIIKGRLASKGGRIRDLQVDYLAYCLLDIVVDNYFKMIEVVAQRIEDLEEQLLSKNKQVNMNEIYNTRRDLLFIRRSVWPIREIISGLLRHESPIISRDIHVYLRDLYDHAVQIIETIELLRDMISNMLEMQLSAANTKLNEIMKVLTIISTIFMPLTFLSGLYGMNFKYMPELESPLGYPLMLLLMFSIFMGMLAYFKRKKWF
jgi:magnesium transporter